MLFEELRIAGIGAKSHGAIIKRPAYADLRYARNADRVSCVVLGVTGPKFIENRGREGMHEAQRSGGENAARRIDETSAACRVAGSELVGSLQPVELHEQAVAGAGVEVDSTGRLVAVE